MKYFFFIVYVKTFTRYIASCAHTQTTSNTQTQNSFFLVYTKKTDVLLIFYIIYLPIDDLLSFSLLFWGQDKIVHVQSLNPRRCLKCNNKNCVFAECFENNYFVCMEVFIEILYVFKNTTFSLKCYINIKY